MVGLCAGDGGAVGGAPCSLSPLGSGSGGIDRPGLHLPDWFARPGPRNRALTEIAALVIAWAGLYVLHLGFTGAGAGRDGWPKA